MKNVVFILLAVFFTSCTTKVTVNKNIVEASSLLREPEKYDGVYVCTTVYAFSYGRGKVTHLIANQERDYFSAPHILKPDGKIEKFHEGNKLMVCGIISLDAECFDVPKTENSTYCAPSVVDMKNTTIKAMK